MKDTHGRYILIEGTYTDTRDIHTKGHTHERIYIRRGHTQREDTRRKNAHVERTYARRETYT